MPLSTPLRVGIVDDQKLFRKGLRMIVEDCPDCQVIFEAEDGRQFFKRLAFEPLDVVVLDIEMPNMDGIETLKKIRQEYPDLRVIILTMHDSNRLIIHLMELGANGFLLKDEDPSIVCEAITTVHKKGIYFRDYVSKALLDKQRSSGRNADGAIRTRLSDRELEILYLLCKEHTSKEIAEKLFLSARTVEGHRRNIQEKVGAKNLAGLVMYAVDNGIV